MDYYDLSHYLKRLISCTPAEIEVDEQTVVQNFDFFSRHEAILPGGSLNQDHRESSFHVENRTEIHDSLERCDAKIPENIRFRYHIFRPKEEQKAKEVIFLFHGFNEKYWTKYLPWAHRLVQQTGKAVVLFPIAFHMNRAPQSWSRKRDMYGISEERIGMYPELIGSSLVNVAISTRLHNNPLRFIWSGLQSYYDMIDLVSQIRSDRHPAIDPGAAIDFFTYSIGGLLAQILMMSNSNGYFSRSKLCLFCGGAVFNRLSPVSRFILDSEAVVNIYSCLVEHLESHIKRNDLLREYLGENLVEGLNFRSMINYKTRMKEREELFLQLCDRIYAVSLLQDTIIPSYEVMNTLKGMSRTIPIRVDVLDYPYEYRHEEPFPVLLSKREEVHRAFVSTFDPICEFLR